MIARMSFFACGLPPGVVEVRAPGREDRSYRVELTEGFDSQPVGCIGILRPMLHKGTFIQAVGRGLRRVDPERFPGIVGFDDTPVARVLGLTSVAQPLTEAAARCMDLLTGVLDGGITPEPVLLQPTLVIRQSA